jgi:hypothetical protein
MELYLHSPIRMHDVALNKATGTIYRYHVGTNLKVFICYISSVQEMRRSGILNRIRRAAWPQDFQDDLHGTSAATTLDTVTIFHHILAVGLLLSIFILVLEQIWWKIHVQSRNKAWSI